MATDRIAAVGELLARLDRLQRDPIREIRSTVLWCIPLLIFATFLLVALTYFIEIRILMDIRNEVTRCR